MIRTTAALIAPLMLTGCANGAWGIYLVEVPQLPEIELESDITENFDDAEPSDEPGSGGLTQTIEGERSPGLIFAQMVELDAKKEGVLVVGDAAYKGTWDKAAKEWVFTHDNVEDGSYTLEGDGYKYMQEGTSTFTTTYRMNLKEGTGTLSVSVNVDSTWTETDEWDPAVGIFSGQIGSAAADYLDWQGSLNEASGPDCSSSTCELVVVATGSTSGAITFTEVDADDDALFDAVENSGQPVGQGEQ